MWWQDIARLFGVCFSLWTDVQRRKDEGGVGAGGIIFSSREERMKRERFTYDTVDLPQHDTG